MLRDPELRAYLRVDVHANASLVRLHDKKQFDVICINLSASGALLSLIDPTFICGEKVEILLTPNTSKLDNFTSKATVVRVDNKGIAIEFERV